MPGVGKGEASVPTTGSVTFCVVPVPLVSVLRHPPSAKFIVASASTRINVLACLPNILTSLSPASPGDQDHCVAVAFKRPQRTISINRLQHEACSL
jgi:hypothetical protein